VATSPFINGRAVIYAGVTAGILSTIFQLLLWWIFFDALPELLYRDARLAAAIVMGRSILPPPATFDLSMMLAATAIHFTLSVTYSMALAWLISSCSLWQAILIGSSYGLALFGINMFGFTIIFPWFTETRDWITLVAHIVFGITAAGIYKMASTH